jgi:asparagine synthase (glutamine-hydrolysing)
MCGIVGIASKDIIDCREWLSNARDLVSYRGPDSHGEWWSRCNRVGFGHRRLSIIDLSDAGHQPMTDQSAMYHIVFNGEIYNYVELREKLEQLGEVFYSDCDTEVLLLAYKIWGVECLSHLNGMFAFAIYDERRNTLFMARDRIGEKPLFYTLSNGELRFSSELKSLMTVASVSSSINMDALDFYLSVGYIPGSRSIVNGINKLPPAHALMFDLGSAECKRWKYWDVPSLEHQGHIGEVNEEQLLCDFETLLEDSVHRQMQADVPVGVLLSGGVDSSLVTAMAVRKASHVKTFTVRFSGHKKFDETKHARLIAEHFKTEHIELEAKDLGVDLFIDLAQKFDYPIIDSSIIPTYLVSQLVKQHCTVVLGGDGGDELFGGYKYYSRLLWMQKYFGKIPKALRMHVANHANKMMPIGMKGRNWLCEVGVDFANELPMVTTFFDPKIRGNLLKEYECPLIAEEYFKKNTLSSVDLLQKATRMDLSNFLAEDILVKVDRASMLNSLEVRSPLLDYRIVEFAFGQVPSYLKATSSSKKQLLKMLTQRVLPSGFDQKRKQGFTIPLNDWLVNGLWRDLFYDVLTDSKCMFDRKTIDQLLVGQDKGRNNSERLFGLVFFEIWRQHHGLSL